MKIGGLAKFLDHPIGRGAVKALRHGHIRKAGGNISMAPAAGRIRHITCRRAARHMDLQRIQQGIGRIGRLRPRAEATKHRQPEACSQSQNQISQVSAPFAVKMSRVPTVTCLRNDPKRECLDRFCLLSLSCPVTAIRAVWLGKSWRLGCSIV